MDQSWWNTDWLPISLYTKLKESNRVHHKLSDFILKAYQLEDEGYFDFGTATKRIALLDNTALKRLVFLMGLIVESNTIASAIQRKRQQAIKQVLGEADYLFALKNRFRFNTTTPSRSVVADQTQDFDNFKDTIYQSGLYCLANLLQDVPQGFVKRVLLKLPKAWSTRYPTTISGNYSQMKARLSSLFKEIEVPWDVSH